MTRIKGTVVDAQTKEPLPFVNVAFKGANVGTTTDFDGKFSLETQWGTTVLQASFVGYKTASKTVQLGKSQEINFQLTNDAIEMETFTVKADKKRYRNKDNPAVELIKLVIDHKDENRKESLDYYEFDKYEKIEIDLNNITEEFLNKGWLKKKFQVVLDHIDTSEVNGKPYLPIFLRETASKMYYRKKPKTLKEYQYGSKMTGFEGYLDDNGISFIMDKLYQDIDIYDNNIDLLSNQFTSPISPLGTTIYKYFIIDTLDVNGYNCINLAFTPRNKADFAFKGNMYILNDSSTYAVTKVQMTVTDDINLNFVKDLQLDQEFTLYNDSIWLLTKDKLVIDYNLTEKGRGMFGKRTVNFNNHVFNKPASEEIYNKVEKIIKEEDMNQKTDSFWVATRPDTLTKQEEGVYFMIDSIQKIPAFKRTMDIAFLFITGWKEIGIIEIGPLASFYSFNDVEGFRLRSGFRTTQKFSKKNMFESYGAYGFKDKEWKYLFAFTHSFNRNFLDNPQNRILVQYQHETIFPGQDLQFLNDDNFLLSFKRGNSDQMLFIDSWKLDYNKESHSGFAYNVIYEYKEQRPLGRLFFQTSEPIPVTYDDIKTDAFDINLRFAPNEQFYQGKNFRLPIPNKYPIFNLSYRQGIKGLTQGEIEFSRLAGRVSKRFYLAQLGFCDIEVEGGKIFGQVPYPLLNLPQANQSFFLQEPSFNMMNFMEFLSDEYTSVKLNYYFNGFIFNKIPLFKRLKWREVISAKALYGNLTSENDPTVHPDLFRFPTDPDGNQSIFTFDKGIPYVEVSAGIMNFFKVFRIELLQRLTYLDNPNIGTTFGVPGLGIRAKGKVDF
ncbi:MAG: carboxypeptidase-like regulatory domain-containing protein [Flavobacteriales bacterium]|nr:carboxypeptidase-like regulatory domain-containing protein [Flavobacteriales bacterium]